VGGRERQPSIEKAGRRKVLPALNSSLTLKSQHPQGKGALDLQQGRDGSDSAAAPAVVEGGIVHEPSAGGGGEGGGGGDESQTEGPVGELMSSFIGQEEEERGLINSSSFIGQEDSISEDDALVADAH